MLKTVPARFAPTVCCAARALSLTTLAAAALLSVTGCQDKQGAKAPPAAGAEAEQAVALSADSGSARSAGPYQIIRKDYEYEKSKANVKFDVKIHLENIGNSDKAYNLINKLIYKGKNFDEYAEYAEKQFIDGADGYDGAAEEFVLHDRYSVICNSDAYVIFENEGYSFSGGAHGNGATAYITIDLSEEKILADKDLVRPVPDALLKKAIKSERDDLGDDVYLRDNIWPPDAINFCGKNVALLWNPYTITPYVVGQIRIELQDDVIKQYLTDNGKKLRESLAGNK